MTIQPATSHKILPKSELFKYIFDDGLTLIAVRSETRKTITWYLECIECQSQHMLRRIGPHYWTTSCEKGKIEWVITPEEYFIQKSVDFSLIMGR